jgi:cyclopropane fatty-acyl-phospholipid synthase-like methyltransferase
MSYAVERSVHAGPQRHREPARPPIVNMGYWGDGAVTVREARLTFVRRLAERLPELQGRRVLDAGRGAGGTAALLAVEYGADVDAVNIAPERMEGACAFAADHGIGDRLRFHVAGAAELPFEPESFDVVFSLEAAHGFADKARFVREAYRVLAPGGMLALSDLTATRDVPLARRSPSRGVELVTADAWRALVRGAGFEILEHRLVGPAVYPGHRRWLMLSAAERRRAILAALAPGRGAPGTGIRHARAWWLEFVGNRSAASVTFALGLREYVWMLARRPSS